MARCPPRVRASRRRRPPPPVASETRGARRHEISRYRGDPITRRSRHRAATRRLRRTRRHTRPAPSGGRGCNLNDGRRDRDECNTYAPRSVGPGADLHGSMQGGRRDPWCIRREGTGVGQITCKAEGFKFHGIQRTTGRRPSRLRHCFSTFDRRVIARHSRRLDAPSSHTRTVRHWNCPSEATRSLNSATDPPTPK